MVTITLILNVIDYYCDYILSNHDYNHDYSVYETNVNVLPHIYSLTYIYNTDMTIK